jgi:predicted DNA-binding protein
MPNVLKDTVEGEPLKAYQLRDIPGELNNRLNRATVKLGRSKRIVILDAVEKYLDD